MTVTMCTSLFHLALFHKVCVNFICKICDYTRHYMLSSLDHTPAWLFNQGLYLMFWWRVLSLRSFSTSTAFSKQTSHSKSMCQNAYLHVTFIFEHLRCIYILCMCVFMLASMYYVSDLTWLFLLLVFLPIFENSSSTIFFYLSEVKNMTLKVFLVSMRGVKSACPDLEATLNVSDALWWVAFYKLRKIVLLYEPNPFRRWN